MRGAETMKDRYAMRNCIYALLINIQLGQGDFEDRSIPTEIPLNKVNPELVVNKTVCGPWSSFVLATDKKIGEYLLQPSSLLLIHH